jgi:gliding motility-associated-like protein
MKRFILGVLCICSFSWASLGQNIWVFGSFAGLDFTTGNPVPIQTAIHGPVYFTSVGYVEGCASVSNANGLLFYTEGSTIWTKQHMQMPNGSDLTGLQSLYTGAPPQLALDPTSSTTQAAAIAQVPDTPYKFYVFSLSQRELGQNAGRLYYSVVDMTLNGGNGDVEPGRKTILLDTGLTEKMTVTVGDRCNVWLLVHSGWDNAFKAFEITDAGINPSSVISFCGGFGGNDYISGVMKVSPDRKKLLTCNINAGAEIYDFDAATGIVSNPLALNYSPLAWGGCYGGTFSPDNSKVYSIEVGNRVYQYDLTSGVAATIKASRTSVGNATLFSDMKIGPDNKIYFFSNAPGTVSRINLPNVAGIGCQVVQNAVTLLPGTQHTLGLPNEVAILNKDTIDTKQPIRVCFKDSLTLQVASDGWDYKWNTGSTDTQTVVTQSGMYTVAFYTPPCVLHRDTFLITFDGHMPAIGSKPGCRYDSLGMAWATPIPADTTAYTYEWHDANNNNIKLTASSSTGDTLFKTRSGSYTLIIKTAGGCDTSVTIIIPPPPPRPAIVADTIICQQDTVQFQSSPSGYLSYLWDFGDGTTSALEDPAHAYVNPGIYQVNLFIQTPEFCYDTATILIIADTMPSVSFTTDKASLCEGQGITCYPVYTTGAEYLLWTFNGVTDSSATLSGRTYASDTPGALNIVMTAAYRACRDTSFSSVINVYPYPLVNLGPDDSICLNGEAVALFNHTKSPDSSKLLWSTGDSSTSLRVRHPGIYSLTVTSKDGCSTADSIEVLKNCYIDIPNGFTPNGDGLNDYFLPRQSLSSSLTRFHMIIFNRWGQVVFETSRIDGRGWDGKYNGVDQPGGVYIYLIEAELDGHTNEKYHGNVTLLR